MRISRIAAAANPYAALVGTVVMLAMLLAAISLTPFDSQWVVFLGGVLAAATLAFASRTVNARWVIARRTAQLNMTRAKLATETRLRMHAEESLARVRNNVELVNEALPAMLTYIDREGRMRYHNHAYARSVGLEDKSIDGRRVEDIVGRAAYCEIEPHLKDALQGRDICYERTQIASNGETCRLHVQYLPHYGDNGEVAGVFAILTDVTGAGDLGGSDRQLEQKGAADVGARLISALEHDEFTLYCQAIAPLGHAAADASFYEVLLRLNEEEENHLPPGAFLPLAEELGLLHEIDRWVVRHVVDFAAEASLQGHCTYFVNLSAPTILDPGFAQFVRERLAARGVAGEALCFESPQSDVLANPAAYREFICAFEGTGCRFAVSGFGCNPLHLRFLKQLRVDFLKLDGGIVLNMLSDAGGLAKVKAINQVAHAAGMRIIAECVEDERTRAALEGIGTDFAQGFGIDRPRPMRSLDHSHAVCEPSPELQEAAA
jgi:PAS domain S-box-containing protein